MKNKYSNKCPRLYVDDRLQDGQAIPLSSSHFHYLSSVLRLTGGDSVRVFNGKDGEWLSAFHPITKKSGEIELSHQIQVQPTLTRRVHLLFAPIKKQRMDFMIEKAVELGVTDLHPVLTQNTNIQKINKDRIVSQIIEAVEQCERLRLPILHEVQPLEKKCLEWDVSIPLLFAVERHECPHISVFHENNNAQNQIALLIGPEGGFTQEEQERLLSLKSISPVSLGNYILRAETAALYGLTFLC